MTQQWAAVEEGWTTGGGDDLVYGIGDTPTAAVKDAQRWTSDGESRYDVIPITAAAAAYVRAYGGEVDSRLVIRRDGVTLRTEGVQND